MTALRLTLLFAAVLLAPLAFLIAVQVYTEDELPGVTANPEPVLTQATEREVRDHQTVTLALEWSEGRRLIAPPWHGTVQRVLVSAEGPLTSGQRIATVDGVDRFVYATPEPFYRSLRSGDTGPDVEMLHEMLLAMRYMESEPPAMTTYSYATYLAVYDLEEALGVGRPTGQFDPGWVAWLPESPFEIGSLSLEVAASAPPPGGTLASERSRLTAATVSPSQPGATLSFEPGTEYVLTVEGQTIPFDTSSLTVPAEGLAVLETVAEPSSAAQQPSSPFGPGGGGGSGLSGAVERATPLRSRAVPASAVMVNAAGDLCVWQPEGQSYAAVPVRVQSSRAGVTDIIDGLEAGATVLANPAEILADPSCPSL